MNDRLERIESLKAGSLSAIATGIAYGTLAALDRFTPSRYASTLAGLALEVAIAGAGGFLFGVTYRYIIRTDRNDHLSSGAVLAFGLVRGLAQVNVRDLEATQLAINSIRLVSDSIVLFTIARYAIDYALNLRWISPFESSPACNDLKQ
jgi:hypothetical protein